MNEITVAPGRYGDINGNGLIGETSEEGHAGDNPCGCLVFIDKPLAIRSRNGAKVTLIEGRPKQVAFRIVSDNFSLGVPVEPGEGGFLMMNGATVDAEGAGIAIQSNIALKGAFGFRLAGLGGTLRSNEARLNLGSGFILGAGASREIIGNTSTGTFRTDSKAWAPGDQYTSNQSSADGGHGLFVSGPNTRIGYNLDRREPRQWRRNHRRSARRGDYDELDQWQSLTESHPPPPPRSNTTTSTEISRASRCRSPSAAMWACSTSPAPPLLPR